VFGLFSLPAVDAKRYGWIESEFCVFNPSATPAATTVRACHQPIQRIVDFT
jgi:hypothetical protein